MTIISASRRTDIPAFYSEWFMNRIREGYFVKVNPYNPSQRKRVGLLPEEVAVIVFWSKNPQPMLEQLPLLDDKGYRYFFHFTLNNYHKLFEPKVPVLNIRLDTFRRLSDHTGPSKVIWRYDPIIISNLTPVDYHLEHFARLAGILQGYTERVIISLLVPYAKVRARLSKLQQGYNLKPVDIRADEQRDQLQGLAEGLGRLAAAKGLEIYSCSEKIDLAEFNIRHGSCIDAGLCNRIFNLRLNLKKDKYQRPECLCAESVDMGFYDTCQFGCSYCYANSHSGLALKNMENHRPESPTLLG